MNITCVISSLGGGGAERSIVNLATSLQQVGYQVTLLTLYSHVPDAYQIPERIKRIRATPQPYGWQRWYDLQGQIRRVQRRIQGICNLRADLLNTEPDIAIAYVDVTNILVIQALLGAEISVIATERSDPRFHKIGLVWTILRHLYYPFATKVVVQTEELRDWIQRRRYPWRAIAIPNPVLPPPDETQAIPTHPSKTKHLVAVGRLAPVKQFDQLLIAFSRTVTTCPEWQLTMFGDGDLKDSLRQQVKQLGLQNCVMLPGRVPNPAVYLKTADLFVMTSQYEGFPNALCEAMACGLPAISYDCPSGPRAIIRHGVDGLLVPANDLDALSQALIVLMQNDEQRRQLAARAPDVLERFSVDRVMKQWVTVIEDAVSKTRFRRDATRSRR